MATDRDLTGKVALITGSTRNIGMAIALRFAEHGARVMVHGRDRKAGMEVVNKIRAGGGDADLAIADLYKWDEMKGLVETTVKRFGKLDILVPSGAGGLSSYGWKPLEKLTYDDIMSVAYATWLSKVFVIRNALDYMIPAKQGKIIVISTDAGRVPTVGESIIGGGAAASLMTIKSLSREMGRYNIRVNAITVSSMEDAPLDRYREEMARLHGEDLSQRPRYTPSTLRSRQLFPVSIFDVAECALWLAADTGNAVTGQIIAVNGGLSPLG